MREILFRGKAINRNENYSYRTDYKNGDWVYGLLADVNDYAGFSKMTNTDGVTGIEVDTNTVGQFTGLTDKNGEKIFEGDIFKDSLGVISVVEWSKDGRFLGFTLNTQKSCRWDRGRCVVYIDREPSVEVIGNIFDNPELLEVQ